PDVHGELSAGHVGGVPAAVHEQLGAGDVGGVVGGQEDDGPGHLEHVGGALHGDLVDDGAQVDVTEGAEIGLGQHRCRHDPRADRVDPDTQGGDLVGHRTGEA